MAAYTPFDFVKITEYLSRVADDVSKQDIRDRIDIYEDRWCEQIRAAVDNQFEKQAIRDKLYSLITQEMNLFKRVINEVSLVYKWPAKREAVITPAAVDPADEAASLEEVVDQTYSDLIDGANMSSIMKQVNRYTTALNQVLVRPCVRQGKLEYDMITLDTADIITDPEDWRRIVAVKYYVGLELPSPQDLGKRPGAGLFSSEEDDSITVSQYSKAYLWTLEDYEEEAEGYDEEGQPIPGKQYKKGMLYEMKRIGAKEELVGEGQEIEYMDEEGQPVLPFVLFWKGYPARKLIDLDGGQDMIDATIGAALDLIHYRYLLKFNSYKMGQVTTRNASKLPSEITLDPGAVFVNEDSEGNSTGLEVLDFTAALSEVWDNIQKKITLVLSNWGISPANFTLSGNAMSGWALQISNQAKLEAREDQIEIYREREKELFRITRIVWNADRPEGAPEISEGAEFRIDFAEPEFPKSPDEEKTEFEFLKAHNVKTDLDLLMEYNPDLTREEAEVKLRQNKALNSAQAVGLRLPVIPGQAAQIPGQGPGQNVTPGRQPEPTR